MESGVIWFAYAECRTCQCVGRDVKTRFSTEISQQSQEQEQESPGRQGMEEPEPEEEEEEVFDILDWIDDNLNYVFAGAVTLGVLYVFVTIVSGALLSSNRSNSSGSSESSSTEVRKKGDKNK